MVSEMRCPVERQSARPMHCPKAPESQRRGIHPKDPTVTKTGREVALHASLGIKPRHCNNTKPAQWLAASQTRTERLKVLAKWQGDDDRNPGRQRRDHFHHCHLDEVHRLREMRRVNCDLGVENGQIEQRAVKRRDKARQADNNQSTLEMSEIAQGQLVVIDF